MWEIFYNMFRSKGTILTLYVHPKLPRRNTGFGVLYIHNFLCQAKAKLNMLPYISLHVSLRFLLNQYQFSSHQNLVRTLKESNIIKQKSQRFFLWFGSHIGPRPSQCWDFDITVCNTDTLGRTPLDEWSARRSDLCMRRYNNRDWHECLRRDSNPPGQQREAADPRHRRRGHRDQLFKGLTLYKIT